MLLESNRHSNREWEADTGNTFYSFNAGTVAGSNIDTATFDGASGMDKTSNINAGNSAFEMLPKGCSLYVQYISIPGATGWYGYLYYTDTAGSAVASTKQLLCGKYKNDCCTPLYHNKQIRCYWVDTSYADWSYTTIDCSYGYGGTPSISRCSAIGEPYSLSGCYIYDDTYANLGSGVKTTFKLLDPTSGNEPDDNSIIYCNDDGKMVKPDGTLYEVVCGTGYLSADLALYSDGSATNDTLLDTLVILAMGN